LAEILSRHEIARWGVEGTHGTPPASAFKRLLGLTTRLNPAATMDFFTPAGWGVPTIATQDMEQTNVSVEGRGDFNGLIYPTSAAFGAATITTPGGGTTSRDWDWNIAVTSEIDPVSFTIEQGQTDHAKRAVYCTLSQLAFDWLRGPMTLTGEGFGRAIETGITLTAGSLADVDVVPIHGKQISIYLDTTAAGLGGTLLTRARAGTWQFGTGRTPAYYVNAAANNWIHTADGEMPADCSIIVQANTTGWGLLDEWRDGSTRFLRVEAVGSIIEGALPYLARFDAAVKIRDNPAESDQDRVWGVEWPLRIVYDATWAAAAKIKIRNVRTAL
jgi:hypothetical protein